MTERRDQNGLPVRPPQRGSSADRAPAELDDRADEHGPIYRALGRLETRVDDLEQEIEQHRIGSAQDRRATASSPATSACSAPCRPGST